MANDPVDRHIAELDEKMNALSPPPSRLRVAPIGTTWVCGACGKTARDRYDGPMGWDVSCMLNSFLCDEATLVRSGGRVVEATAVQESATLPPKQAERSGEGG